MLLKIQCLFHLDKDTIYKVPEDLHSQGLDDVVVSKLGLKCGKADLSEWKNVVYKVGETKS
jgi:CTP synthase